MNFRPNQRQRKIIQNHEGIYLVDAGPGTGKTTTITKKYIQLLREVKPKDILLITFTRNAADQMKEKIMKNSNYSQSKLREAPINTFHGYCHKIINQHGFNAPNYLGIKDNIVENTKIVESDVLENRRFRRYMDQFMKERPEYNQYYRIVRDKNKLLELIKSLASKGIIPSGSGWYRNSESYLNGNLEEFRELAKELNRPKDGKRGKKQSELRGRLTNYNDKCYTEEAPDGKEIRGSRGSKKIDEDYFEVVFEEDREELKDFVHDLYFGYLKYCLSKNYLNFSFYLLFSFVLLAEDHKLRSETGFNYVMIDEFQDTNEIQLKLALLLSNNGNICVVGDWKQSIYSFQYADVENILEFEKRLRKYKEELNKETKRIDYNVKNVEEINLIQNYRSTQEIIDFSETALTLRASYYDNLNTQEILEKVTSLNSNRDSKGEIFAIKSEKEKEAILEKIERITKNPEYTIHEDGEERMLEYKDIGVLSRITKFGLDLQDKGQEFGVPVSYEGGVELFKANPSIILLAWLRILEYKESRRGWSVVLEKAGYCLDEVKHILEEKDYPGDMLEFRAELKQTSNLKTIAKTVYEKYGINNAFSVKIIEVLDSTFSSSYMNLGEIIQFIEENIESGETYEIDNSLEENVVTVQTIHGAKGLEYPVIFVSGVNYRCFPSYRRSDERILYVEPIGLRKKKKYVSGELPYLYDNWKTEVLNKCLSKGYDEERRLMYVAMSRAKKYLYITANKEKKSQFFKDLKVEEREIEPSLKEKEEKGLEEKKFKINEPKTKAPIKIQMKPVVGEAKSRGRGTELGTKVHKFAELYAKEKDIEPRNGDEENVKEFIDSLEGEKLIEKSCSLPLKVGGRKVMLRGKVDLIHLEGNRVEIIDYKTEKSEESQEAYKKQLNLYYHALDKVFEDKEVSTSIFYTKSGEKETISTLKEKKLIQTYFSNQIS